MNPKIWIHFVIVTSWLIHGAGAFILPQSQVHGPLVHYSGKGGTTLLNSNRNTRNSGYGWQNPVESSCLKQIFAKRIKSHIRRLYSSHHSVVTTDLKTSFLELWKENLGTITLGTIYGIKVLKLLIYIRYLLEWLPQVNPYLPPFDTIYQTTDAYLKVFQSVLPRIAGVDTSGIIAWFILENIEAFLSNKPEIANNLQ